jgi:hypothetical protein
VLADILIEHAPPPYWEHGDDDFEMEYVRTEWKGSVEDILECKTPGLTSRER